MFHIQDGLHFGRTPTGDVRVILQENKTDGAILFETTIPADGWASIVASVSKGGETIDTWRAARAFHDNGISRMPDTQVPCVRCGYAEGEHPNPSCVTFAR